MKKINITKKTTFAIILVVFFVILDKILKYLALNGYFNQPFYLIGNVFSLNFSKNYNIAFSLPASGPILIGLIIVIIIVLLYFLAYLIEKRRENNYLLLIFLIIGAFINLIDRIRYGFVIDYFDLKYFTVFNTADIMIVGGILGLILVNFKNKKATLNF